jgi:BolA protein
MSRQDRMTTALNEALHPDRLIVVDESEKHHGHGGWREGGETHYRLEVVSSAFAGKTRIARHRLVTDLLKAEFDGGLHALALTARAPGEG